MDELTSLRALQRLYRNSPEPKKKEKIFIMKKPLAPATFRRYYRMKSYTA